MTPSLFFFVPAYREQNDVSETRNSQCSLSYTSYAFGAIVWYARFVARGRHGQPRIFVVDLG